jgi:hypothetical protein
VINAIEVETKSPRVTASSKRRQNDKTALDILKSSRFASECQAFGGCMIEKLGIQGLVKVGIVSQQLILPKRRRLFAR